MLFFFSKPLRLFKNGAYTTSNMNNKFATTKPLKGISSWVIYLKTIEANRSQI